MFSANALYQMEYKGTKHDYYTGIYRQLPPHMKTKVMVFTQGCGGFGGYSDIPQKALTFCTPFSHGRNCGCSQIRKAELAGQIMKYAVRTVEDLERIP